MRWCPLFGPFAGRARVLNCTRSVEVTDLPEYETSRGCVVWAQGPELPTTGKISWTVKIDRLSEYVREGSVLVGVIDAAHSCSWSWGCNQNLFGDLITRLNVLADGALRTAYVAPAPEGVPDLDKFPLYPPPLGRGPSGTIRGAEIEVHYDADAGSIAFCTCGQMSASATGFKGIRLRPFVKLQDGEAVTVSSYFTIAAAPPPPLP